MVDLSVLIPARNELFLSLTIADVLANSRCDTEVIAVLDGQWPIEGYEVKDDPRVHLIYHSESIGQRAATNEAARMASGKYVMKLDAHCAMAPGFDEVLLADMQDDWTMVPVMRNLHVFDWVCPNGHRRYQGPSGPCEECGQVTKMDVVWIAKPSPQSTAYCFDAEPHFQYHNEFKKRPEGQGDITETMSLQGSCFLMTRERYFDLNVCDEAWGTWGSQGIEVACKSWLSGGRVVCNHKTWYAHCFRTQGGDFGFPYRLTGKQVRHAKRMAQEQFFLGKWERAIKPLSWLVEKFWPVPGWADKDLRRIKDEQERLQMARNGRKPERFLMEDDRGNDRYIHGPDNIAGNDDSRIGKMDYRQNHLAGIVYYACNTHKPEIDEACRAQLREAKGYAELVCVSLNKPLDFGDVTLTMQGERGPLMMHRQILAGLEASTADYVFLCESDVLYHPSHFDFTPKRRDVFYYNVNVWRLRYSDGLAVWTDDLQQVSGLCASRELLIDFYTKRNAQIERDGFNRHYEPGIKQTVYPRMRGGKYGVENWQSDYPNICIRHDANLTASKWSPDEFRNPKYAKGWRTAIEIPGWGATADILADIQKVLA